MARQGRTGLRGKAAAAAEAAWAEMAALAPAAVRAAWAAVAGPMVTQVKEAAPRWRYSLGTAESSSMPLSCIQRTEETGVTEEMLEAAGLVTSERLVADKTSPIGFSLAAAAEREVMAATADLDPAEAVAHPTRSLTTAQNRRS
jgi:hypothetical protein